MKSIKTIRTFLVCTVLTASVALQSMDKAEDMPKKKKPSKTQRVQNWVTTAGRIILGKEPAPQEKILALQKTSFVNLPADMQFKIVDALRTTADASSFAEVAQALRTLARANKQLNNLINNSDFCLTLIKNYARMFKTTDAVICSLLRTQAAKERLALQNSLIKDVCTNFTPERARSTQLIDLGADIYFTDGFGNTPAEECIINYNIAGLEMLLDAGVDPEFIGNNKISLYDLAASRHNRNLAIPIMQMLDNAIEEKHALKN